jgi:hypothetical protein
VKPGGVSGHVIRVKMYTFKRLLRGVFALLLITGVTNLFIHALSQSFGTKSMWTYLAILAMVAIIFTLDDRCDWGFSSAYGLAILLMNWAKDKSNISGILSNPSWKFHTP